MSIVGLIATGLVFLGTFVGSVEDAVTTYVLVLTSPATPWAVITMIGFWQTRGRFDEPSLQVFDRRERGGACWFSHGWNIDAVLAWAVGSAVGVLSDSTTSFEGPVAHWLGGLDASVVTSAVTGGLLYVVLVAVRPHEHAPRRPAVVQPAATVVPDGGSS
jgi:purine-cytosine permease-like protein